MLQRSKGGFMSIKKLTLQKIEIIQADYLSGVPLKEISLKHDIKYNSLRTLIQRNKLFDKKRCISAEVQQAVTKKLIENASEIQLEIRQRYLQYFKNLSKVIWDLVQIENNPNKIKSLTDALSICMKAELAASDLEKPLSTITQLNQQLILVVPPEVVPWGGGSHVE
jgi:hypothetical protein